MDKLNSLIIFVRAAQHRSFSVAARQLGISPSSVSKAVLRLEESVGTRLFNRTTRAITLTEDGAAFYERCQQILDELEEAELELGRARSTPTGTLRINLTTPLGRLHIVPVLPLFAAKYPNLKLDVSLTDRMVDLIEEGIDAVVRIGSGPDSRLIVRGLATARLVVCASPTYLARHGEPKTPEDLKHHNCVSFVSSRTGRAVEWLFQRDGQKFNLVVDGNLRLDHCEALLDVALRGAGLVQVYNYMAARAIVLGEVKPVLESYVAPGSSISVLYPQKRHLSAKVCAFVDFISDLMTQLKQQRIVD